MNETIYVFMCAYNAEKTIRASLDSIRKQTYHNWKCHIVDHGSIDRTGRIISEFVKKDDRFTTEYLEQKVGGITVSYAKKVANSYENGYFITLDADDEYDFLCFEEMLSFMQRERLDLVVCGSDYILAKENRVVAKRMLKENLILEEATIESKFVYYHQFMRTVWGKMYHLSIIRKCFFYFPKELKYGSDTIFAMEAFKHSKKAGILAKVLHRYYISDKSQSYQMDDNRIISDTILFDYSIDYLLCKCGKISTYNRKMLFEVYKNALKDTLKLVILSESSDIVKINMLYKMVSNHYTRTLCFLEPKNDVAQQIARTIYSLKFFVTEETLEHAAESLAILGLIPIMTTGGLRHNHFQLLVKMKKYWFYRDYVLDIDLYIKAFVKDIPEIALKSIKWLVSYQEIVSHILLNEKETALNSIVHLIEENRVLQEDMIDTIETGLYLAAELEDQNIFICLKKMQINTYQQLGDFVSARRELDDWDQILPQDRDFQMFKEKIG